MWRLFRYYLLKDFPTWQFKFHKESISTSHVIYLITYKTSSVEKSIRISYSKDTDEEMFQVLYDSLKSQIKDSLFKPKKKKRFLKKN